MDSVLPSEGSYSGSTPDMGIQKQKKTAFIAVFFNLLIAKIRKQISFAKISDQQRQNGRGPFHVHDDAFRCHPGRVPAVRNR